MAQQPTAPLTPTRKQKTEDIDMMILRIDKERRMRREEGARRAKGTYANSNGKRDLSEPSSPASLVDEEFQTTKRQRVSMECFFPIHVESENLFDLMEQSWTAVPRTQGLQSCTLRPRSLEQEFSSCEVQCSPPSSLDLPYMPL